MRVRVGNLQAPTKRVGHAALEEGEIWLVRGAHSVVVAVLGEDDDIERLLQTAHVLFLVKEEESRQPPVVPELKVQEPVLVSRAWVGGGLGHFRGPCALLDRGTQAHQRHGFLKTW